MSPVQSLEAPSAVSNFCPAREAWTVSYQVNGRECSGTVLGFSEAGWHIAGEMPVRLGTTLALHVHRSKEAGTFRIPTAQVQSVEGLVFAVRVDVSRSYSVR